MKKAFTLIEILVVITVLPFVAIAFSSLFATFIRDVPRMARIVQENTSALDLVRHIRDDVDAAVGLPDPVGDIENDERTLLIALPEKVIAYRIEEDGVTRSALGSEEAQGQAEGRWRFRDGVVRWRRWKTDGQAEAVEVHTFVRERISGKTREKLANSYVYFLDVSGKAVAVR
jgi:prepilin-type N-terminal cleavage/methylation domain-containing protein